MPTNASTEVSGFGLYQYNQEVYDNLMASQTVVQLRDRVFEVYEGLESGYRTRIRKLRKAELAAMVAEWDTTALANHTALAATTTDPDVALLNKAQEFGLVTHTDAGEGSHAFIFAGRDDARAFDAWVLETFSDVLINYPDVWTVALQLLDEPAPVVDESVNEGVDGTEVMTKWLALPEGARKLSPQRTRDHLTGTPSPRRDYQSAMEAVAVLDAHLMVEEPGDDLIELIDEDYRRVAVNQRNIAGLTTSDWTTQQDDPEPVFPVTETPVTPPNGKPLRVLVQLGARLVWGTLVAVVNRRTRFAPATLATVLVDGVRRLVSSDKVLLDY